MKLFPFIATLSCFGVLSVRSATQAEWQQFWYPGYGSCAIAECLVPISEVSFCINTDSSVCDCYKTNSCVCTNETFLRQVGNCIACSCPDEVVDDYDNYKTNCLSNGDFTLPVEEEVFTSCTSSGNIRPFGQIANRREHLGGNIKPCGHFDIITRDSAYRIHDRGCSRCVVLLLR
jgi:hypothetical protein